MTKQDCIYFCNGRCSEKKHGLLCPMLCNEARFKEKEAYKMGWDYHFLFGRHRGFSVKELFEMDKTYLGWAYYQREDIDFSDEVLDALKVERITKPGTDKDKFYAWKKANFLEEEIREGVEKGNLQRLGRWSHWQKVERERREKMKARSEEAEERFCNKGRLAWKNQGH